MPEASLPPKIPKICTDCGRKFTTGGDSCVDCEATQHHTEILQREGIALPGRPRPERGICIRPGCGKPTEPGAQGNLKLYCSGECRAIHARERGKELAIEREKNGEEAHRPAVGTKKQVDRAIAESVAEPIEVLQGLLANFPAVERFEVTVSVSRDCVVITGVPTPVPVAGGSNRK